MMLTISEQSLNKLKSELPSKTKKCKSKHLFKKNQLHCKGEEFQSRRMLLGREENLPTILEYNKKDKL